MDDFEERYMALEFFTLTFMYFIKVKLKKYILEALIIFSFLYGLI